MTDKQILEEVYRRLKETTDNGFEVHNFTSVTSFIEQEWQKEDEELDEELHDEMERSYNDPNHPLNKHDEGQYYNMNEQDVNENSAGGGAHGYFSQQWYKKDKRHRGLKISEDGTVLGFNDDE